METLKNSYRRLEKAPNDGSTSTAKRSSFASEEGNQKP